MIWPLKSNQTEKPRENMLNMSGNAFKAVGKTFQVIPGLI